MRLQPGAAVPGGTRPSAPAAPGGSSGRRGRSVRRAQSRRGCSRQRPAAAAQPEPGSSRPRRSPAPALPGAAGHAAPAGPQRSRQRPAGNRRARAAGRAAPQPQAPQAPGPRTHGAGAGTPGQRSRRRRRPPWPPGTARPRPTATATGTTSPVPTRSKTGTRSDRRVRGQRDDAERLRASRTRAPGRVCRSTAPAIRAGYGQPDAAVRQYAPPVPAAGPGATQAAGTPQYASLAVCPARPPAARRLPAGAAAPPPLAGRSRSPASRPVRPAGPVAQPPQRCRAPGSRSPSRALAAARPPQAARAAGSAAEPAGQAAPPAAPACAPRPAPRRARYRRRQRRPCSRSQAARLRSPQPRRAARPAEPAGGSRRPADDCQQPAAGGRQAPVRSPQRCHEPSGR